MSDAGLNVERAGTVLRITLARPEVRNAFDAKLIAALTAAFGDPGDARVVVLDGEGTTFCAGADFEWMRASAEGSEAERAVDANALLRLLETVDTCPAPVVALVHGHALGAGAGLVACSDVAIAHSSAAFAFSEVKFGIVPSVISPFVLARIAPGMARRYLVTGERFDAATAWRIGLVHDVTDDLAGTCARIVAEFGSAAPNAARAAKRLVLDRPDGLETARRVAELRAGTEGLEGMRAFLEGRAPRWLS